MFPARTDSTCTRLEKDESGIGRRPCSHRLAPHTEPSRPRTRWSACRWLLVASSRSCATTSGGRRTRPASGWRLGATCHDVIGLVLRHGVALIVGGLAIGFADAAVVTQVAQRALLKFVWVEIG